MSDPHKSQQSPKNFKPSFLERVLKPSDFDASALLPPANEGRDMAITMKTFAPLMTVIQQEQSAQYLSHEAAKVLGNKLTHLVRVQSEQVCHAVGIDVHSQPWARSFFAMYLSDIIAKDWKLIGQGVFDKDYSNQLVAFAQPILDRSGVPGTWENTSQEVSLSATCLNATHSLHRKIINSSVAGGPDNAIQINEALIRELISCAKKNATDIGKKHTLNGDSVCSLMQSLIKNGAGMLESVWENHATTAKNYLAKDIAKNERDIYADQPYPWANVKKQIPFQIQMLGDLAELALPVQTEIQEQMETINKNKDPYQTSEANFVL